MAKLKFYYYECLFHGQEIPYISVDRRVERWRHGRQPLTMHSFRCTAAEHPPGTPLVGESTWMPATIIRTERLIGRCFTEILEKRVSRARVDYHEGVTLERIARLKRTKAVKFRLLEAEELTASVLERAIWPEKETRDGLMFGQGSSWGPALFDDGDTDVELPAEAAAFAASTLEASTASERPEPAA